MKLKRPITIKFAMRRGSLYDFDIDVLDFGVIQDIPGDQWSNCLVPKLTAIRLTSQRLWSRTVSGKNSGSTE